LGVAFELIVEQLISCVIGWAQQDIFAVWEL
jgi:hypothetical protein